MTIESDFQYAPEAVKDEFLDLVSEASVRIPKQSWKHFTPTFLDTESQKFDTDEAMEIVMARQKIYREERIAQMEGTVAIHSEMPVTVFMIGDIHWGSIFTNNELWEKHRKALLATPGAYVMFLHNLVDNGMPGKFPNNTLTNGVPPDIQFKVMQKWIKGLDEKGKVLGAIEGDCHEGWSWQVAGVSASNLIYGFGGRKFPVLDNGGIIHLSVNDQLYNIGLWHKAGPFNSRFNPEHALRQNRRLHHESQTDVEVGAHYHNTVASSSYEGGPSHLKPVQWLRVGAYKGVPSFEGDTDYTTDKWSIDKFGTSGQPPAPSVMLWENQHRTDSSLDFDTGLEKHMAIRSYALLKKMVLADKLEGLFKK